MRATRRSSCTPVRRGSVEPSRHSWPNKPGSSCFCFHLFGCDEGDEKRLQLGRYNGGLGHLLHPLPTIDGHPLIGVGVGAGQCRSEEHTSELQSRENLVCRLLLEKKKTRVWTNIVNT